MESSASSIVNALGGGSGVDMVKLASDLSAARFATQIQQLESRNETIEARISAAATLKNQLTQLASAMGDRVRTGDLAPSPRIGNSAVATASVAPGARPSGAFSLEVTQLASSQVLASNAYASAESLVGEGTLTLRFGTAEGTGFTADAAREPVSIEVTADDTATTLADKINAAGDGVTAYVATNAQGAQLVIKGQDGMANGFVVETSGAGTAAGQLGYLAWTPGTDTGQRRQSAADAAFLFDGVEMTAPGNDVNGLPGGLSLTLGGTNIGAPTTISFSPKGKEITSLMNDLVGALNDISAQLKETASPLGGELGNDSGARALKRELAGLAGEMVMPNAAAGEPKTLGDLGLALNRDGTFRLDTQRLAKTLETQPEAAGAMFTVGLYGVYATLDKLGRTMGNSADPGTLGGSIERYTRQQEQVSEKLIDIAEQQEALRAQMTKQFAWADRNVAMSKSTLSFLQAQLNVWNQQDD